MRATLTRRVGKDESATRTAWINTRVLAICSEFERGSPAFGEYEMHLQEESSDGAGGLRKKQKFAANQVGLR